MYGQGGPDEAEGRGQIFTPRPVALDRLGVSAGQRIHSVTAANGSVLAGFHGGDVVRWYPIEDESSPVDFGRDRCGEIGRMHLEPKGFHALVTNLSGDTWYLNFNSNQAKLMPKLKGHVIETVSWDPDSTAASTRDLIVGTHIGQIVHVVIEGKERTVKSMFAFEHRTPISGLHRERMVTASDGTERTVLFVAAGCAVHAFVGMTVETLFQRYQGEGGASRALIYEVPRDSPRGDLQVDDACVGLPGTKVLFWLTGVGVLSAFIKPSIEDDKNNPSLLESPPGVIPFPHSKSSPSRGGGGNLVSSLLPPPPPPAPLSMALTKYHIVFVFEDRWVAVSRITHEVVQQQDWAQATYGALRCLASDVHGSQLWLCSERHIFELTPENEGRNVWKLHLQLEEFEDALAACTESRQRTRVVAAHADWLFRKGRLVESARKFAEATAVPFEHVALRFLGAGKQAALLEYLRFRLRACPGEDQVTRALLCVWAVEISLANLNELRLRANDAKGRAALDAERSSLRELLKDCSNLDVHATIYHLLQSHGWLDELAIFAEARRDFTTVILHHVSRLDCLSAIRKLADFQAAGASEELVCCFAPVLFGAEPKAFTSLLLRPQLSKVDPLSVLPAVYAPQGSSLHRAEAMRYLEHIMRHHPELSSTADIGGDGVTLKSFRAGNLRLDSNFTSCVGDDANGSGLERHGWASGSAILNALTMLYAVECEGKSTGRSDAEEDRGEEGGRECVADEGDVAGQTAVSSSRTADAKDVLGTDAESILLRFLGAQEANQLLDPRFALRICRERGLVKAIVLLYGLMGMHEEAVAVALEHEDVDLAKQSACKPPNSDKRLRQKLWLRIAEHQAATGDVQKITSLLRESQELTVRDVLPFLSDDMTIDAFQAEICECLDAYEGQIVTLRQEMDDHRRALQAFKEDLKQAEERVVTIAPDQSCEICGALVMKERFYAFACTHACHEACLRALLLPTLKPEKKDRLFKLEEMRVLHQAIAAGSAPAGSLPSTSLEDVEDELDGILADDCPLCGQLMIDTVTRPFVDPEEVELVSSWSIKRG